MQALISVVLKKCLRDASSRLQNILQKYGERNIIEYLKGLAHFKIAVGSRLTGIEVLLGSNEI